MIDVDAAELHSCVIPKMQTDSYPALYTVVEDSLIDVMRQRDKGI